MIILLQTFQLSSLRSYKAAANRDAQLHQGELLNCICLSELQTLTFSCLRVIIKGQSDTWYGTYLVAGKSCSEEKSEGLFIAADEEHSA